MNIAIGKAGGAERLMALMKDLLDSKGSDDDDSSPQSDDDPLAGRLADIEKECADAAKAGIAPLFHAASVFERSGDSLLLNGKESLDAAEEILLRLMMRHGLRRRKLESTHIGRAHVNAWTYFVPAETNLFNAIDGSHPLVLAVTAEPRRFMKSVINRYASDGHSRPVFVWTSASGLFEVERGRFSTEYHSVSNAARVLKDIDITWFDLPALRAGEDARELSQAKALQEASQFQFEHELGDRRWKLWCALTSEDSLHAAADLAGDEVSTDTPRLNETERDELAQIVRMGAMRVHTVIAEKLAEGLKTPDLSAAVTHILDQGAEDGIYLLADAHAYLSPDLPAIMRTAHVRVLKDAYYRLRRARRGVKVVLFSAEIDFPEDLREEIDRIELPLPLKVEREVAVREQIDLLDIQPSADADESTLGLDRLVEAASGMTLIEIHKVMQDVALTGDRDPEAFRLAMLEARKRSVARTPALEVVDLKDASPEAGGLDLLVAWLNSRKRVFDNPEAARLAGIDRRPRGVLLLGMPGSGKSLVAKVVAHQWNLPLLRLDMGAVQNKYVGESEARIRQALKTVASMAPCVLWIDELDKAVAQGERTSSHSTDLNIRATLLNWMQEYKEPVFVVATANRIGQMPPELMRAGRFDARFFLGCPGDLGRQDILRMHLRRRGIKTEALDIPELVRASLGFTGAEIEQLVLDSLYDAFSEHESGPPVMAHFLARLRTAKPLIKAVGAKDERGTPSQLDEVWALIDQGRVELASADCLNQAQVARLIDPYLYRPAYCRKESISGFESLQSKAERLSMGAPHGGAVAAVLDAGDDWIFVYTNVRFDRADTSDFKFLEQVPTIENNGIFDTLVLQYGVEQIVFKEATVRKRFEESEALGQFSEMFTDAAA